MKFDLWMPTASPMTTAALLDAVAEGAEERGIGTVWVGEHVVLFGDYDSRYPYADDGRIPAPPGSGLLEPLVTLLGLALRVTTGAGELTETVADCDAVPPLPVQLRA